MAMQYLSVKLKELDIAAWQHRRAEEQDASTLIDEDTCIMLGDTVVLVYIARVDADMSRMMAALKRIPYVTARRQNGLYSTSKIFGYAPRAGIRNKPCRAAVLAAEAPTEHDVIEKGAEVACKYYEEHNPAMARQHLAMTLEKVRPEYRIRNTMYTSGIVNNNNPLRYHFDAGNYQGVWSAMFSFKHDIGGGYLSVPELDIKLACNDCSLTMFDGQSLLHGVTPIRKQSASAVRYTVVYYSLKQMWSCDAPADELTRIRMKRAETERKRAAAIAGLS